MIHGWRKVLKSLLLKDYESSASKEDCRMDSEGMEQQTIAE